MVIQYIKKQDQRLGHNHAFFWREYNHFGTKIKFKIVSYFAFLPYDIEEQDEEKIFTSKDSQLDIFIYPKFP